jgi:hypothetical protein
MLVSRLSVASALLSVGMLASACGGGDGGGGQGFSSGIEPSKRLSEVTAAEAQASCEAVAAEFDEIFSDAAIVRIACAGAAAQNASTVAECQELAAECERSLPQAQREQLLAQVAGPDVECTGELTPVTQCSATVAQYDRCVSGTLAELRKVWASISCQMAPRIAAGEDFDSLVYQPQDVAACDELEELCPSDDDVILGGRVTEPPASGDGSGSGNSGTSDGAGASDTAGG